VAPRPARAQVSITTESYDNSRTVANLNETILNTSNVNVDQFGKLFSYQVDGAIYAQPLYVSNVTINGTVHNVVYVATMNDVVYAFDADSNAGSNANPLWKVDFRNAAAGIGPILSPGNIIADNIGIESTPVIDPTTNTIYLVSYTTESGQYVYRLHAMDITSGAEKFGGPVVLSGSVPGTGDGSSSGTITFDAAQHMQRTALGLANGMVFISFGAFGDLYTYHGWILTYNTQTLQQVGAVCITPNGHDGSIWASGRGPVIDSNNNIYFITGDGDYDGVNEFGDSFVKYGTTNGTGFSLTDWFTPDNFATLDSNNEDLGSSGPLMIPGTSLILGGGKGSNLYVVNTANMGHEWAGNSQIVQWWSVGGRIFTGPAFYNRTTGAGPWLYIWPIRGYLTAYHFNGSSFDIAPASQNSYTSQPGSYSAGLAVTANGSTPGTGIVWASMPGGPNEYDGGVVSGIVRAFDASNLNSELWNSGMNSSRDNPGLWQKFRSPLVVNGKLYVGSVTDVNHSIGATLSVYGLLAAQGPPPGLTSSAKFLGQDTTTQGKWQGTYGSDGYDLASSSQSLPTYATFSVQNAQQWVWQSGTSDPRALEIPAGGNIAACWYNATAFQFNSNFTDGKTHELTLYLMDWDYHARTEVVQVVDEATNYVLDTENVTNFGGGIYLSWNISGNVIVTVTSTGGPNTVVSGVFFEPSGTGGTSSGPESVTVNPTSATLSAGGTQPFTATVTNGTSQTVTWAISSVTPTGANPGSFSNTTPGLYSAPASITAAETVTVTATSSDNAASASATITLNPTVVSTGAIATFVKTDTATQGNWKPTYGTDGYALANVTPQSIPGYATFAVQNETTWTWNTSTTDPRALTIPVGSGGIAATWYGLPSFNFAVNFTDGQTHQLALYAVDWDNQGRSETIQILDANSNNLLDARTVSSFNGGAYLVWNISGSVKIIVTAVTGPNPVVSGVFFGGSSSSGGGTGVESVAVSPTSTTLSAGGTQPFTAIVTNGSSQSVTWAISSVTPPGANGGSFSNSTPGLYLGPATITTAETVTVTATSSDNTASATATITLNPTVTQAGASATFVKRDTATQGSWPGIYGSDGYALANLTPQKIPAYATFAVQNQQSWTWTQSTTDPRALQMPASSGAIASAWYNASTFNINVDFTDSNTHQVAVYAVDWDMQGRSETIQVVDAKTSAVLDTETISNFSQGTYLVWNITGNVQINVNALTAPNGVVNGVFFEPSSGGGGAESVTINPTTTILSAGGTQQFTATVANAASQTVTWTISSVTPSGANTGSFSTTNPGLYMAPASVTVEETVTVTATSADSTASATATITLNPTAAQTGNTATFIRKDVTTQGNWPGTYGGDGYVLAGVTQSSIPAYASFAVQNQLNWTWANGTSDPRALELPSGAGTIASTWYGYVYGVTAFRFDVNLAAGTLHQVSLYAVDWDNEGRSETLQIVDANTNAVLDTESISNFTQGVYLVWNISGDVKINVTVNGGPNAVVSGVFFN